MSKGCLPLLTSLYFAMGPQWQNVAPPFTAAVVGAFSRPHWRGQGTLATAGKMPVLQACQQIRLPLLMSGLQNPLWNLVYQTAGCRTPASAQERGMRGMRRVRGFYC
ncbi:MAG TPA: hypothetical protein VN948_02865 [Terriglobales bacterium]|nr:hypothetical protein [Terriglobales bacterium]